MEFYHYFYNMNDPFSKITDIESDNKQEYIDFIKKNALAEKTYNIDYISKRIETEEKMREIFIKKGGKPEIKHPHYFVLENCDYWFFHEKQAFASIVLDSSEFDSSVVSFTYGDSLPTFDKEFDDKKEYRMNLYTINEINNLINKYSLPQLWNQNCKYGFENYIEVQVWTDKVISNYRFKNIKNIYDTVSKFCNSVILANKYINTIRYKLPEQFSLKEVIELLKKDNSLRMINDLYQTFKNIYKSDLMHGVEHSYRTALYMCIIGKIADVKSEFLYTMVLTAFAHDIGRTYSSKEDHGLIGATMISNYFDNSNMEIIKKAITAHSIQNYNLYLNINKVNQYEQKLILWLRDVDALDYIRFGIRKYNPEFICTDEAKRLMEVAMQINIYMFLFKNDEYKLFDKGGIGNE